MSSSTPDIINKPDHYYITLKAERPYMQEVEIDCLSVTEALGFNSHHYLASALAYIWRCLKKGSTISDLKKARFYLDREIKMREDEANKK